MRRPGTVTAVAIISVMMGVFCGCGSLYIIALPAMMEMQKATLARVQARTESDFKRQTERRVEDLSAQREAATSPDEQQRLDEAIQQEQARHAPDLSKMMNFMVPPEARIFYVGLGIVGVVVNLLFLVSGIGLFPMMEWARKLNLTASFLQIVVSVGSTIYTIAVVSPAMARGMHEMMQEIQKSLPPGDPGPPMGQINSMLQLATGIGSGASTFIICTWLVAAICMLSTPRVKAAFRSRSAARATAAHG